MAKRILRAFKVKKVAYILRMYLDLSFYSVHNSVIKATGVFPCRKVFQNKILD
jgi:hypothetical protein